MSRRETLEIVSRFFTALNAGDVAGAIDLAEGIAPDAAPELLAILDSTPGEALVQRPDAEAPAVAYDVPVSDFALRRFLLGSQPVDVALEGPAMIVATGGAVEVSSDAASLPIPVGEAVFATAEESHVRLTGPGRVFIAQPG